MCVCVPCNYSARSVCSQSSTFLIYILWKLIRWNTCVYSWYFSSFSHTEMEHFMLGRNKKKLKQIWIPVVRWHREDLYWWVRKLSCFLLRRRKKHDHNKITHISHIALPLLNGNLSIYFYFCFPVFLKPQHSF